MRLEMKMGERMLLFRFTTRAWLEIEEKIGSLSKLLVRIEDEDRPLAASITLTAACATAGEKYRGGSDVITEDMLIDGMSPKQIKQANMLARKAFTLGMRREEAEADDEEIIDVVLEEIRQEELKKKDASDPD